MVSRGLPPLDPELRQHIRTCPCSCDHMGYGNCRDYRTQHARSHGTASTAIHLEDDAPQIPPLPASFPARSDQPPPSAPPFTPATAAGGRYYNAAPPRGLLGYDGYQPYDFHGSMESCSCSSGSADSARPSLRGPWCVCVVVCIVVATITAGLGLPIAFNHAKVPPPLPKGAEERLEVVKKLLKDTPLIDGHNDLPWNLRKFVHNQLSGLNLSAIEKEEPWSKSKWSHTDIPRLKAGLLGAQFWSAYVPCKAQHLDAVQVTLEQIDVIKRLVEYNSKHFALVRTSQEIRRVHKEGRIASLIGVEGGHALGNSLAVLRTFYNLGARYLTITHSCDTPWATGQDSKTDDGLSEFGRSVVKEMNRLGMIVDLSHTSVNTAKQALNASSAPVIFSHSSAYSLCNTSRNVPDDVLRLIAQNGGVIMVNFYTFHVTCNKTATIQDVINHINHIRSVAGIAHVGIGAGYDGINMTPSGLEDVSRYPYLLAELLGDSSWSESDIVALAGQNLLRVFERVEAVRDEWRRAEVPPLEDRPPPLHNPCSTLYS